MHHQYLLHYWCFIYQYLLAHLFFPFVFFLNEFSLFWYLLCWYIFTTFVLLQFSVWQTEVAKLSGCPPTFKAALLLHLGFPFHGYSWIQLNKVNPVPRRMAFVLPSLWCYFLSWYIPLFDCFFFLKKYFILTIVCVGDQNYPISLQAFLISTAKTVHIPLIDDLALSHARFWLTSLASVLNFFCACCPGPFAYQWLFPPWCQQTILADSSLLYCSRKALGEQLWPLQSFGLLEEPPWTLCVVTGCSANPVLSFITAFTYIQHLELETYCSVNSVSDFFNYKMA